MDRINIHTQVLRVEYQKLRDMRSGGVLSSGASPGLGSMGTLEDAILMDGYSLKFG